MERALIGSTVPGPFLHRHVVVRAPRRNSPHHGLEDNSEETVIGGKERLTGGKGVAVVFISP
jgi:hypothetical protein